MFIEVGSPVSPKHCNHPLLVFSTVRLQKILFHFLESFGSPSPLIYISHNIENILREKTICIYSLVLRPLFLSDPWSPHLQISCFRSCNPWIYADFSDSHLQSSSQALLQPQPLFKHLNTEISPKKKWLQNIYWALSHPFYGM